MSARMCYLTFFTLMMLPRRITSSPSLITCNGCMGKLIDTLSNISNTLAKHRGAESLDTIAGAKQIELLSQRLETTKQEIDEQIKQKLELFQALKSETSLALDKVRSIMEAEISSYQKTSTDSIKSVEEKAAADTYEVKVQIIAVNSELQEIKVELRSTREQIKAKIDADRTSTLRKLEEGMALVQETARELRQDLTSYKTTTQQTTSSLDGRVAKVNQDMASALEKMTSELKGTKVHCTSQTTQNKEQAQQAIQKLHHEYRQLKAEFKKKVDAVKASTETAVREAKASCIQELESFKQSLQPIPEEKVAQQTTTSTKMAFDYYDYGDLLY